MNKFKAGDKVKCIQMTSDQPVLTLGNVYTVDNPSVNAEYFKDGEVITVKEVTTKVGYYSRHFELYKGNNDYKSLLKNDDFRLIEI